MLLDSARPHLGDEPVRAVFRGQTAVSPLLLPVVAPVLLFFLVKQRAVIVTDSSIITVQESVWLQSKVTRVVSRYACDEVTIRRTRFGLKIGNDPTVYGLPGSLGVLGDTVSAVRTPRDEGPPVLST